MPGLRDFYRFAFLWLIVFSCAYSVSSQAGENAVLRDEGAGLADLERISSEKTGILGLSLKLADLRIKTQETRNGVRAFAEIVGSFIRPEWELLWEMQEVSRESSASGGKFAILVPVEAAVTRIELNSVGPHGEVETEQLQVSFIDWNAFSNELNQRFKKRPLFLPGVNYSLLRHYEDSRPEYVLSALNVSANYSYPFADSQWDWEMGGEVTVLPLSRNLDVTARLLRLHSHLIYTWPGWRTNWQFGLLVGAYYANMFVQPARLGFTNLGGPEFFPRVRYVFRNGDFLQGYLKLSPITDGIKPMTFSDRKWGVGVSYNRGSSRLLPGVFVLDGELLHTVIGDRTIEAEYVSLGVGWVF